ncbi:pyridine nucleotide-disulfide oxidoreductase, putative [Phytophthora infestans T30-4]|uniref:Pyridine nucleotide-disulphide oxidoreductase, putative n=1 Tax=Phytophthora infestans (strain T30-4) TaxID=403677 RepID=D0NBU8_PHYIT|nr:pyridine nucleotide-disulfide oxidoreductase, putative [Phytophthora infestans T30-4]EEY55253.1 pyridine nucleotide-disulphide oxidoreductase, putative [Phytophthora infestans T30-4]|eukprot:XP_002903477.1 pyridine nucleotide-disulphide oxidoreductase, putative [Phytophthora infestans T30-4]
MTCTVIVGGGPAGINTAQALAKNLTESDKTDVVVLEKSAYFYHVVGAPRAYANASFMNKMFIPYDNAISKNATKFVRIVRGVVTKISAATNEILYHTIDNNDNESTSTTSLHFDNLVLAMGSTYTAPIKQDIHDYARSDHESKLQDVRSHIETANRILVVGGGAVGCEVAAEIKSKYPNKSVMLLEANARLISGSNLRDKFYVKLSASLADLGVKVILGERLSERMTGNGFETRTLYTNQGTAIESDIQLLSVKVNEQLQLDDASYAKMFALGDVCNHSSQKMAFIAGEQGKFLAGELTAALVLPLGPNGGVTQLPFFGGIVLGDWVTWMMKLRDYFAGQFWSNIGATAPK